MHKLNRHQIGLTVGAFIGFIHLIWVLLMGFGFAQTYLSFIFGMHFLSMPFTLQPFSWITGLELIVLASIGGYIMGSIFVCFYNKFNK